MSHLRYITKPKLKEPSILIAGFPGIASIGKIVVEHLINSLEGELFLELYSEYLPEWTIKQEDGLVSNIKLKFYQARGEPLILLTSEAQAVSSFGQYSLTEEVLKVAKQLGVKTVITAAAYVLSPRERRKPVVGTATNEEGLELLKRYGVEILQGGVIVGMNGLLPCLSPLWGMKGLCVLGTTHGGVADVRAARNILEVLCRMLDLKVDLEDMEERYRPSILMKYEFPGLTRGEESYIK